MTSEKQTDKMTTGNNKKEGVVGFKENLRFFQSQIDRGGTSKDTLNGFSDTDSLPDTEKKVKNSNVIPTVDTIISNVKNLRTTQNNFKKCNGNNNFTTDRQDIAKRNNIQGSHNSSMVFQNEQSCIPTRSDLNIPIKESSLLSNFNPSFDILDTYDPGLVTPKILSNTTKKTTKLDSNRLNYLNSQRNEEDSDSPDDQPTNNGGNAHIFDFRSNETKGLYDGAIIIEEESSSDNGESEYDIKDFVVHRNNYDDYIDEMCDFFTEDMVDINEKKESECEEIMAELVENNGVDTTNNKNKRYIYYDELEAIPEEDESFDDIQTGLDWDASCDNSVLECAQALDALEFLPDVHQDIHQRKLTNSWDPKVLIALLYQLEFCKSSSQQTVYKNKEGHLEVMPPGRKKASFWNPWKKKFIRLKGGFLYMFDNKVQNEPFMKLQLMGGKIDIMDKKVFGIDDQKGHFVVLKCSNEEEVESWEHALYSQCKENFIDAYTNPCPRPLPINRKIVIIDLGSSSVRAGILMSSPTLPQIFFPNVCATHKTSRKKVFGAKALEPNVRHSSFLSFPLHPSAKVHKYSIDTTLLPDLLEFIFQELDINPKVYKVQLSMPRTLNFPTKLKIARILLDDFQVKGLSVTHQAILALSAYNSKSGVIVDIGDRIDVVPIIEGYIVESGVTRLPFGGQRLIHHLKHALTEQNISLFSDVETYLVRYALENMCYVAENYTKEMQAFHTQGDDFKMTIPVGQFFQDIPPFREIMLDMGRFSTTEGLFTPEMWGLDHPGLNKLVYKAIYECGVDMRKEMTKNIYVSGGLSLLPGFVERLQSEIDKMTPKTLVPKVHASPYRYHMSYLGASQVSLEDQSEEIFITKKIWLTEGNTCFKKWHT